METDEIVIDNMRIQLEKIEMQTDQMSSPIIIDSNTPIETPETETDDNKKCFKIPIKTADNQHITPLVEVSDGTDYTPSEEKSGTDIDFTPVEEKQLYNHDEPMDCDSKEVELPSIDFFIEKNVVELARSSWRGSSKNQRYLKGCLWSPDGTCLLTTGTNY